MADNEIVTLVTIDASQGIEAMKKYSDSLSGAEKGLVRFMSAQSEELKMLATATALKGKVTAATEALTRMEKEGVVSKDTLNKALQLAIDLEERVTNAVAAATAGHISNAQATKLMSDATQNAATIQEAASAAAYTYAENINKVTAAIAARQAQSNTKEIEAATAYDKLKRSLDTAYDSELRMVEAISSAKAVLAEAGIAGLEYSQVLEQVIQKEQTLHSKRMEKSASSINSSNSAEASGQIIDLGLLQEEAQAYDKLRSEVNAYNAALSEAISINAALEADHAAQIAWIQKDIANNTELAAAEATADKAKVQSSAKRAQDAQTEHEYYLRKLLSIDAVMQAEFTLAEFENEWQKIKGANNLSDEQATVIYDRHKKVLENDIEVKKKAASATEKLNLSHNSMLMLNAAAVNSFQALASGMDVFRVAMMEGAQVAGAMGQNATWLSRAMTALVSPTGFVVIGTAAVAGAFLYAATAASGYRRELETLLRASGASQTSQQLWQQAQVTSQKTGLSTGTVSGLMGSMAQQGAPAQLGNQIAGMLRQYSAAFTGGDATEGGKQLVEMYGNITTTVDKLNQTIGLGNQEWAEHIKYLVNSGDKAGAAAELYKKLDERAQGVTEHVGALTAVMRGFGQSLDWIEKTFDKLFNFQLGGDKTDLEKRLEMLKKVVTSTSADPFGDKAAVPLEIAAIEAELAARKVALDKRAEADKNREEASAANLAASLGIRSALESKYNAERELLNKAAIKSTEERAAAEKKLYDQFLQTADAEKYYNLTTAQALTVAGMQPGYQQVVAKRRLAYTDLNTGAYTATSAQDANLRAGATNEVAAQFVSEHVANQTALDDAKRLSAAQVTLSETAILLAEAENKRQDVLNKLGPSLYATLQANQAYNDVLQKGQIALQTKAGEAAAQLNLEISATQRLASVVYGGTEAQTAMNTVAKINQEITAGRANAGDALIQNIIRQYTEQKKLTDAQQQANHETEVATVYMQAYLATGNLSYLSKSTELWLKQADALRTATKAVYSYNTAATGGSAGGGWVAQSSPSANSIGNVKTPDGKMFRGYATPEAGVAGTASNLLGGYSGLSMSQIGEKWAPRSDAGNNPVEWTRIVSKVAGLTPNTVPNLLDQHTMAAIVQGIGTAEKTKSQLAVFTPSVIQAGVAMAQGGGSTAAVAANTTALKANAAAQQQVNESRDIILAKSDDLQALYSSFAKGEITYTDLMQRGNMIEKAYNDTKGQTVEQYKKQKAAGDEVLARMKEMDGVQRIRDLRQQLQATDATSSLFGIEGTDLAVQQARLSTIADLRKRGVDETSAQWNTEIRLNMQIARSGSIIQQNAAYAHQFNETLADGLTQSILQGKSLKSVFNDLVGVMTQMIIKQQMLNMLSGITKSIGSAIGLDSSPTPSSSGFTDSVTTASAIPSSITDNFPTLYGHPQRAPMRSAHQDNGVVVNLIDKRSGSSSEHNGITASDQGRGPDGKRMIQILVEDAFTKHIKSGNADKTMRSSYGATRQPAAR